MIDIQELTKVYSMGETEARALDGVSLWIDKGEWVAITGPSGSRKSTLMNILGCLDQPTSGSYRLDGIEVAQMKDNDLAAVRNRKIGFVFQGFNLLSRTTAIANVELPLVYAGVGDRKQRMERSMAALSRVGLAERVNHRPNELSGGHRRPPGGKPTAGRAADRVDPGQDRAGRLIRGGQQARIRTLAGRDRDQQ
jgi:putative ABC transport system ATP-binding protein